MGKTVQALLRRVDALEGELREVRLALLAAGLEERPSGSFPVVLARVASDRVALLGRSVERVVPLARLAPLPEAPPCVLGALDLHGELLPVIDVVAKLGHRADRPDLSENILVTRVGRRGFGMLVQEALGVEMVDAATVIEPPPELGTAAWMLGMIPLDDTRVPLLGVHRFVISILGTEGIDGD